MPKTIVQKLIDEVKEINKEIARYNNSIKKLRNRKDLIEKDITAYLQKDKSNSITYNNSVIQVKDVTVRERKKKSQKEMDIISVLKNNGVPNSDSVYREIMELNKGKAITKKKVKISDKKNK